MRIQTSRKSGFTLVEIMIVVAIIGLLAAIAIPNFVKARTTAQTNTCIANLRQISGAVQQFALETKLAPGAAVTLTAISGGTDKQLKGAINTDISCPASGTYSVVDVSTLPACSVGTPHVILQ